MIETARRILRTLPGSSWLRKIYQIGMTSEQWARVVMNRETRKLVTSLHPEQLRMLEISGDTWGKQERFKEYKAVHFPEFDICASALDETFDLIIVEQVFEHLLWPYRAGRNIHKMLCPGGHVLVTTPFLIRIHDYPIDCSRWTEIGIRHLLAECGFDLGKIKTASWGNRACVRANFFRWAGYRPMFHSLRNEPDFPLVVWALAQK